MNTDPARIASELLGGGAMLGGARGTVTNLLSGAAKGLLGIDAIDQEIPGLGAITDGLTVAAGIGSLVASAFDVGDSPDPTPPKEAQVGGVGGSFGV